MLLSFNVFSCVCWLEPICQLWKARVEPAVERGLCTVHLRPITLPCPVCSQSPHHPQWSFGFEESLWHAREAIKNQTGSIALLCKAGTSFVSPRFPACISSAGSWGLRSDPILLWGREHRDPDVPFTHLDVGAVPHPHLPLLSPSAAPDERMNISWKALYAFGMTFSNAKGCSWCSCARSYLTERL